MIKAGITGIIGSGKSTVAKIFEILGAKVFYADTEAKKLYHEHKIIQEVASAFGPTILDHNNQINLKKLSDHVFQDSNSIERINNIIHPRVKSSLSKWINQQDGSSIIIYESALLFESGFYKFFDKNIVISAPENLCIKRVIKRSGLSEDEVKKRMSLQLNNEQKKSRADYIIDNSGNSMVLPQVLKLFHDLSDSI